ncbi:hypothetical protein NC651_017820 [Populus alba x Populus x berolinensis]|nr:hypothetical protein NC651_017820 [Populus alba x Populus x berolinensis]
MFPQIWKRIFTTYRAHHARPSQLIFVLLKFPSSVIFRLICLISLSGPAWLHCSLPSGFYLFGSSLLHHRFPTRHNIYDVLRSSLDCICRITSLPFVYACLELIAALGLCLLKVKKIVALTSNGTTKKGTGIQ